ncbi:MAG: aminotransferase class V-fold PLP-dependent enzyme [Oscillospiraceae bacterium]|jgi:selenocysteine lyase/cysteine desulfurase|nr:aminotransferase class V-fold PLP-dependent enzyme [Oscillospiraceae bacterium]
MIYLDSAATTLEKPPSVPKASAWAMTHLASPGRGGHKAGMGAAELVYRVREQAAQLFHVGDPERVILTSNATHGLNVAIHSLVRPGGTVLISGYEHNAVTRPLHAIPGVKVKVAAGKLFDADEAYAAFEREISPEVDVVICNHVSNVFGFIQPVERIAKVCRERGKSLVVDASQSAGIVPVNMEEWNAAFVAMPGHKGLYGPQGTGLLLCGADTVPLLYGGTGSLSAQQEMPDFLPDRLEAGTQNVCGAAGLLEGIRFVSHKGIERIHAHECWLAQRMMDRLAGVKGLQVFRGGQNQSGLFSVVVDGMDCEAVAEQLARRDVAVRAGLHCAPLAHQTAGTAESGTIRFSFSAFNSAYQVDQAAMVFQNIVKDGKKAW